MLVHQRVIIWQFLSVYETVSTSADDERHRFVDLQVEQVKVAPGGKGEAETWPRCFGRLVGSLQDGSPKIAKLRCKWLNIYGYPLVN